ncbi:MAG: 16S rRNA (cytosine(1402)-N(4))-methyltransferase RsmH [Deltaproteobacteria bacterium]|nr:16S rRNA (cytosine(1402)-N(4))-methyltransferase RsmH [Deltaproteobacteria bacterium]
MSSAEEQQPHIPVMAETCLELLSVREGGVYVDVTAGAGGHMRLISLAAGPTGKVIATDRDLRAHQDDAAGGVAKALGEHVELIHAPFSELPSLLEERGIDGVDGLLCDLGVSSMQLDERERGFSFRNEGPIDMRMDSSTGESAYELISRLSEDELADVLFHYGEERKSRRVARGIKYRWPMDDSTLALSSCIQRSLGGRKGRIHPATRSFQALRIAVNRELDELDSLLASLPQVLKTDGRAVIISFHSLEDRKVKRAFIEGASRTLEGRLPQWKVLTKKPRVATDDEVAENPRSRSAKVRAVERIEFDEGGER